MGFIPSSKSTGGLPIGKVLTATYLLDSAKNARISAKNQIKNNNIYDSVLNENKINKLASQARGYNNNHYNSGNREYKNSNRNYNGYENRGYNNSGDRGVNESRYNSWEDIADKRTYQPQKKVKQPVSIPALALGGAALGLGVYDAVKHKNALHPLKAIGGQIIDSNDIVLNNSRGGKILNSAAKKIKKNIKNGEGGIVPSLLSGMALSIGAGLGSNAFNQNNNDYQKRASIDLNKVRDIGKKIGNYSKAVTQESLRAVPYTVAPLAVGYAINKDIRFDGGEIRSAIDDNNQITLDIPTSELSKRNNKKVITDALKNQEKVAKLKPVPWKEFFKNDMPEQAVRGVARTLPLTAITVATGRNIRGRGEKIIDNTGTVEPGTTRIVISTTPKTNKSSDRSTYNYSAKTASEIDNLYENARGEYLK